jgi:rhodanese-related sulfurtransferase
MRSIWTQKLAGELVVALLLFVMRNTREKHLLVWGTVVGWQERTKMGLVVGIVFAVAISWWLIRTWLKSRRERREVYDDHRITAEKLHRVLASPQEVLLFDVRQPLDLLANAEMIPGATRIAPRELLQKPWLIPKDKDSFVYCTCPSDKTSREILDRARALGLSRVKLLEGGLAAWKANGYAVEPYRESFHLDTAT